jgi:hypothetical protein
MSEGKTRGMSESGQRLIDRSIVTPRREYGDVVSAEEVLEYLERVGAAHAR